VSCVLICIRGPLARAVIAELLAGHAEGADRIEAISAALAARSAQSGDRIGKTLFLVIQVDFFGQGLSENTCYLPVESCWVVECAC
jgi:hypothetical protein